MISVDNILRERSDEIDSCFEFIQNQENTIDEKVFKILKANLLLMLYNLIEATISNTIEEVRNHIHNDHSVDFDCLTEKIKREVISDLKNISPENFVRSSTIISNDIIKIPFKKEKISNGNIDNDVLNTLAEIYGFEIKNSAYQDTNHGSHLKTIKDKRNDLAHGTFSFTEVGKDYTISDLENYKKWTLNYLSHIVNNVKLYLQNKEYRKDENIVLTN